MKKTFVAILAVTVLATGAIFVFAQASGDKGEHPFGRGWGHGRGHTLRVFLRELDLTDEQKAKVKEMMGTNRADFEPTIEAMKQNRDRIRTLGTDGTFDQAQVKALAAEQGILVAKMIVQKESVKAQIFAILTPEQKVKAAKLRAKLEANFEEGMKNRIGGENTLTGSEF